MFKGFYDLTSGMLTQTRNLDVIGNNMSNTATTGYKMDRYADTTFDEVMRNRIGNKHMGDPAPLGTTTSYITALDEVRTVHTQGALEQTNLPLDFAIEGNGYFSVQSPNGRVYTRNGSFMLDNQGYLYLTGQGRVLGQNGQPIYLGTDKVKANFDGTILTEDGRMIGRLGIFGFANPAADLQKIGEGMFTAAGQPQAANGFQIHHKMIERSNIDLVQQMADMITCQRALQSASQMSKMYDQIMTKTATEIGRI